MSTPQAFPLTGVAAGGRGVPTMPNDTASQPKATVGEPAGLASCAQGPAHNHESHAGASEYKVRKASTVRFFLWIIPIFSICRMLMALVHFLCEAAPRCLPHHRGHGLHAAKASHVIGQEGTVPRLPWFSPQVRGSRYAVSRLRHWSPSHGAPRYREIIVSGAAVSGETGGLDTLIACARLVPSSSAWGGQRHAAERAEGLAERWREDAARARPPRRTSFLSECCDGDERLRCNRWLEHH